MHTYEFPNMHHMSRFCKSDHIPYIGYHPRKKSFTNYLLYHNLKTFAIQAISYIKILAKIKNSRKHSRMLPDSRNSRTFSSADNSQYTIYINVYITLYICMCRVCDGELEDTEFEGISYVISFLQRYIIRIILFISYIIHIIYSLLYISLYNWCMCILYYLHIHHYIVKKIFA